MITVKVRSMFDFVEVFGGNEIDILLRDNVTLKELIDILLDKFGSSLRQKLIDSETSQISSSLAILHNEQTVILNKFSTTNLNNGDVVTIFIPIAGG